MIAFLFVVNIENHENIWHLFFNLKSGGDIFILEKKI